MNASNNQIARRLEIVNVEDTPGGLIKYAMHRHLRSAAQQNYYVAYFEPWLAFFEANIGALRTHSKTPSSHSFALQTNMQSTSADNRRDRSGKTSSMT
jgi:hypothetical protein